MSKMERELELAELGTGIVIVTCMMLHSIVMIVLFVFALDKFAATAEVSYLFLAAVTMVLLIVLLKLTTEIAGTLGDEWRDWQERERWRKMTEEKWQKKMKERREGCHE